MHKFLFNEQVAVAVRRRDGITLVELLVVVAIIAILAAISVPMIGRGLEGANRSQAMTQISAIVRAIEAYQREYGRWPTTGSFEDGNAELMNILRARDATGNNGHVNNPRRYNFLDVPAESLNDNGDFIDPWDEPYKIVIDASGVISTNPLGGPEIRRNVIAWSMGQGDNPDRALRTW